MTIVFIITAVLLVIYFLALRGRRNHPGLQELRRWKYAHRGLHEDDIPENSLVAFQRALENGYGVELDIHLMADGNLAVIHDSSLKRTTGADAIIEDLTIAELSNYCLEGTGEKIPLFRQVLDMFACKAPIIVELKTHKDNHEALTAAACEMLSEYQGPYCVESFDPRCIRWLKQNRPEIVRGQLSYNSVKDENCKVPYFLRFLMTNLLSNFWNSPDFISYQFSDRNRLSVRVARSFWRIQGVAWTLRSREEFDAAVKENWIPIFEGFKP